MMQLIERPAQLDQEIPQGPPDQLQPTGALIYGEAPAPALAPSLHSESTVTINPNPVPNILKSQAHPTHEINGHIDQAERHKQLANLARVATAELAPIHISH